MLDTSRTVGLLDGKDNERRGAKLLRALAAALASGVRPSPDAVSSFATLDDGTTIPWTSGSLEDLARALPS